MTNGKEKLHETAKLHSTPLGPLAPCEKNVKTQDKTQENWGRLHDKCFPKRERQTQIVICEVLIRTWPPRFLRQLSEHWG
jgi:hypothetical protein